MNEWINEWLISLQNWKKKLVRLNPPPSANGSSSSRQQYWWSQSDTYSIVAATSNTLLAMQWHHSSQLTEHIRKVIHVPQRNYGHQTSLSQSSARVLPAGAMVFCTTAQRWVVLAVESLYIDVRLKCSAIVHNYFNTLCLKMRRRMVAIASPNLNRFSKFFHDRKEEYVS